jgi:hypothetical protein
MKRCPKCRVEYFDQMLEFCLEDGAKLMVVSNPTATETKDVKTNRNNLETVAFGASAELPKTVEVKDFATVKPAPAAVAEPASLKRNAVEQGYRALEIGTLVFALAHNWWQWLYVDHQRDNSFVNFLLSAEFLIWFLMLLAGTVFGILTLRLSRSKALAYAGLVILAINFLLLLVPRK